MKFVVFIRTVFLAAILSAACTSAMAHPGHAHDTVAAEPLEAQRVASTEQAGVSAAADAAVTERNSAWVPLIAKRLFTEHTRLLAKGAGAVADGTSAVVERTGALVEHTGNLVSRAGTAVVDGTSAVVNGAGALVSRTSERVQDMLVGALDLVGIRYRRGGSSAATGFDCSGFVGYVFRENLGVALPRTALEISRVGQKIAKAELEPGDLVFFKTMRHAFSHVGIYLGDNKFVHAPSAGEKVRVEDMGQPYWTRRYEGARRIDVS